MASKGIAIQLIAFEDQQKFGASLRNATIEPIEVFQDLSSCLTFIEEQDQVFLLLTTSIDDQILERFQNLSSIEAILILSTVQKHLDTCPSKVIGVYPQIDPLLRSLNETLERVELQLNLCSFLSNRSNDSIDFYFYHLWKNYLKEPNSSKKTLIDQGRVLLRSNPLGKNYIDDFEKSYKNADVLRWLDRTRHPFPYRLLLCHALRTHHEPTLSLARSFLNDLQKQMKPSTGGASQNQVYLGVQLPAKLIERFEHYEITDAIAFQCFLPVTRSRAAALLDATRLLRRSDMANVLFKIELNSTPCATQGETLLIDMATPFHVSCVTRSSGANGSNQLLTVIKLLAVDKATREHLFEQFIERQRALGKSTDDLLKQITSGINDEEALADRHIACGEWSKAVEILQGITNPSARVLNKLGRLSREHLNDLPACLNYHQHALIKAKQRDRAETLVFLGLVYYPLKQYDDAFQSYSQALSMLENERKQDLSLIARCLVGMGNSKWVMGELDAALEYAERALAIREHRIKPRDDFDVAACLGNIGNIVHAQGDRQRAISYAKRAVDLLTSCGPSDPRLAAALNNLGAMYQSNDELDQAREHFQRALDCLPDENHPYRKSTLANLARLDYLKNSTR